MQTIKIIEVGGDVPRVVFESVDNGSFHYFYCSKQEAIDFCRYLYKQVKVDLSMVTLYQYVEGYDY